MASRLKVVARRWLQSFGQQMQPAILQQVVLQQELRALHEQMCAKTPDNPALAGCKIYSQTDEDGIIAEVFRRLGVGGRVLVEIGSSDGLENNTHGALLAGWRGVWIDGSRAKIDQIATVMPLETKRLAVRCELVNRDNAPELVRFALKRYEVAELDLLSLDIDGNDLYVLQAIVGQVKPRVIVAEYNGKYPPPISLAINYNASHVWAGDDYYGASLQAFVDALPDYRLVCCNISGANAFFVRTDLAGPFTAYTPQELYQPPRFHLTQLFFGERASLKMLRDALLRE
jgi:hypothetical protein